MAAVLSETITETKYFPPTMRRGDERQRSPSSSHYQQQSSRSHVPPSPRPQPRDAIIQQPPGVAQQPPTSQRGSNVPPTLEARQSFASQQHFAQPPQPQLQASDLPAYPQHGARPYESDPRIPPHLASPAPSANGPVTRSAWPSDDAARYGGTTIRVRDLAHIQSFADESFLSHRGESERRRAEGDPPLKYEISSMPITDIIEMVAGLLTKITTTNDRQHENLHRPLPSAESAANMPGLTSSVLAFHGKNVPSITILSYLSRIHKYCPTTYEVFLSLLVYFDRMTERVNAAPMQDLRRDSSIRNSSRPSTASATSDEMEMVTSPTVHGANDELARAHYATPPDEDQMPYNLSHFFVVDSFNIHRLVIAGVTCASKFFSDVFYTNSRYAKVVSYSSLSHDIANCIFRLEDYHYQNSTILSCNSCCSTTSGYLSRWRN
jgi:PHO85 cyclin-6/7